MTGAIQHNIDPGRRQHSRKGGCGTHPTKPLDGLSSNAPAACEMLWPELMQTEASHHLCTYESSVAYIIYKNIYNTICISNVYVHTHSTHIQKLYIYIYTYKHACTYTCMHTYRHADINRCIHTYIYIYTCICMHTCRYIHDMTCVQTCAC